MKEIEAGTNPAKSITIHGQKSRTSIRDGKNLRKKKKAKSTATTYNNNCKKRHSNREQNKYHKICNMLKLNINRNQSAKKEKRAKGLSWGLEGYPFDFKRIEPDSTHIQVESEERGGEQESEEDVGGDKTQSRLRGALIGSRPNSNDIKTNL